MPTNGESKFSSLLIALGLGAIGGLTAAILARRETRETLRDRGAKSLDYLNRQAGKLRERTDVIVQQGKKLIECEGSDSVAHANDTDKRKSHKERRENLGG